MLKNQKRTRRVQLFACLLKICNCKLGRHVRCLKQELGLKSGRRGAMHGLLFQMSLLHTCSGQTGLSGEARTSSTTWGKLTSCRRSRQGRLAAGKGPSIAGTLAASTGLIASTALLLLREYSGKFEKRAQLFTLPTIEGSAPSSRAASATYPFKHSESWQFSCTVLNKAEGNKSSKEPRTFVTTFRHRSRWLTHFVKICGAQRQAQSFIGRAFSNAGTLLCRRRLFQATGTLSFYDVSCRPGCG